MTEIVRKIVIDLLNLPKVQKEEGDTIQSAKMEGV